MARAKLLTADADATAKADADRDADRAKDAVIDASSQLSESTSDVVQSSSDLANACVDVTTGSVKVFTDVDVVTLKKDIHMVVKPVSANYVQLLLHSVSNLTFARIKRTDVSL